jgi:hypothetical protein
MSVDRNFGRTLSGATDLAIDNLRLGNNINSIRINGNSGLPNQVLAKNGTTNKLEWDFAESTTIPDGSITGNKLASNIEISTTGNITGAIITATDKFIQTGTNENTFNGQLRLPAITTLNSGNGITLLNGGNVELFSDDGSTKKIELDGATGTITCVDLDVSGHDGSIAFNDLECNTFEIRSGGGFSFQLSSSVMTFSAGYTISGASTTASLKSLVLNGGSAGADSLLIAGSTETLTDTAGNLGSIILNTGDLDVKTGTGIFRAGVDFLGDSAIDFKDKNDQLIMRISPSSKKIVLDGEYESNKAGTGTPPTDNTYSDWALDLTETTSHAHIGGNLICDGTIFANVEGSITEEVVECQRIELRDATPPVAGDSKLFLATGSYIDFATSSATMGINLQTRSIQNGLSTLLIDGNNANINSKTLYTTGTTALGTDSSTTISIGSTTGSNQILNCMTTTTNIGSTTGTINNITTLNGGTINLNTLTSGNTNVAGQLNVNSGNLNMIGGDINIADFYKIVGDSDYNSDFRHISNIENMNLRGYYNTNTLLGVRTETRILRASAQRNIAIASKPSVSNTTTGLTEITNLNFSGITSESQVCLLEFDMFFRQNKGSPDFYVRIDSATGSSATPYASQSHPKLIINTAVSTESRIYFSVIITGISSNTSVSFFPKFCHTTASSNQAYLMYGEKFGDTTMKLSWLDDNDPEHITITDPYAPADDY